MTPRKIFSIPLNPKLSQEQFTPFYFWLEKNREWISDVYFTCRIQPFHQDAMGDIIIYEQDKVNLIESAINIQNQLGIKASATFNNIQVAPTQKNLDIFISKFKPIYDAGIRVATIPHTHWMMTGQIKAAFPELFVKNTILREVSRANEVVALAKAGFDYINLDRDMMRDRDGLLRLKQAKEWIKENLGKDIQYSLLANEGCLGNCPVMPEHFHYNTSREEKDPAYFHSPISRVSCPKWDVEDPSSYLKSASIPPWREDWLEFLDLGIDVFKMHGREDINRLGETIRIVERFINNEPILDDEFDKWQERSALVGKPIQAWREKIKNCKFDCWECQYCDNIEKIKSDLHYTDLTKHVVKCIADSGIPKFKLNISGLTSPRVQTLLNSLANKVGTYLEVGSYVGATSAAALKDNFLNAYFVDNWEQQIQPARDDIPTTDINSYDNFLENIKPYANQSNIFVYNQDMFTVPIHEIKNVQLFFYDGPHDEKTTSNVVKYYYECLADEAIIVFDDANWNGVVDGANKGLEEVGAKVIYNKIILNEVEDINAWWNGLYIVIIKK